MAKKYSGNTDRKWDVELMFKLSEQLREDDFKSLKEVIRKVADIPPRVIEQCNRFDTLWRILEDSGKIRVGEYGILVTYLELLHRQDCVQLIREYTTKIDRQMCQHGPSKQTDEPFESRLLQKVEEVINSRFQEFHINQPILPASGAMASSLLPSNPAQTSKASTCIVRKPASAGINKIGWWSGETDLRKATKSRDIGRVKDLLKKGADPDILNKDGWTALMKASIAGHKEVVAVLLENNADVNLQSQGYTALMLASDYNHKDVVAVLLENNADVNLQHKIGYTALMDASVNGNKEVVAILLENGADVNIQSQLDGRTALSLAKWSGNNEVVKMLMAAGAKR